MMEQIGKINQEQKQYRLLFLAAEITDCPDAHCDGLSQSRKKHGKGGKSHKEGNGQQIVIALLHIEYHDGSNRQQGTENQKDLKAVRHILADCREQEKPGLYHRKIKQG